MAATGFFETFVARYPNVSQLTSAKNEDLEAS